MPTPGTRITHEIAIDLPKRCDAAWITFHLQNSSFGAVYSFEAAGRLSRVLWLSGVPCLVEIDTAQSPGQLLARATGTGFPSGTGVATEITRLVRFLWGLDDDLEGFGAALEGDGVLGPLISRFGGLRLPKAASLYECLLVAVLGQQVSLSAAQAIRHRMIDRSGASVEAGGVLRRGYPSPEQLLGAGEDGLRQAGVSRPKCRYLREIATRALQGDLDASRFESLDDERAKSLLMEIPGVGRWTAEIALMRGLGRMDVFPAGDLGLARAIRERASLATTPDEGAIRALADRWRPYRSYAAFYLWMSLAKGAL